MVIYWKNSATSLSSPNSTNLENDARVLGSRIRTLQSSQRTLTSFVALIDNSHLEQTYFLVDEVLGLRSPSPSSLFSISSHGRLRFWNNSNASRLRLLINSKVSAFNDVSDHPYLAVFVTLSPCCSAKMLWLIGLVPEKKSLLLAQKALNYRRIDKVMKAFFDIELAPVTISKRQDVKKLDNLYNYL